VNSKSDCLSPIPRENLDRIISAILFAFHAHKEQERKAGGPYVVHPLRVALQALVIGESTETIMAAALHDVVEDTEVCIDEITTSFGNEVSSIVASLTKPPNGTPDRAAIYEEQLMASSREAKLIKILDIEDNLYDVDTAFPPEKAESYLKKQSKLISLIKGPG
jgi:GTP pyrophosphokinase